MGNNYSDTFGDYKIAAITEENLKLITDLEKTIHNSTNEDIILIAYQHSKDN